MEKEKNENHRTKIFATYIIQQPFKETYNLLKNIYKKLHRPKIWLLTFATATIYSSITKSKTSLYLSILFLIIMYIAYEYEKGEWLHQYRTKNKQ